MSKNILTLKSATALDFFLKSEQYHGSELSDGLDYDRAHYLHHITYQRDKKAGKCPYDARFCHVVMGEDLPLWNIEWLKPDLTAGFPQNSIVNQKTLVKVTPVIKFRKIPAYEELDY